MSSITIYNEYKKLRNYARTFTGFESLQDIWHYVEHLEHNRTLPITHPFTSRPIMHHDLKFKIFLWDLVIVAREIILNAGTAGSRRLTKWDDFVKFIHLIRDVKKISDEPVLSRKEVHRRLFQIAHRQFIWQTPEDDNFIFRYLRVFGKTELSKIYESAYGLSIEECLMMGLAAFGQLTEKPWIDISTDTSEIGISAEKRDAFFALISADLSTIRNLFLKNQAYNESWIYTWNAFEAFPLVRNDRCSTSIVTGPFPTLVLWRVTRGLYYDLVKHEGFDNAFGQAFEDYIGKVLLSTFKSPDTVVHEPEIIYRHSERRDNVDWIIEDDSAFLFIECKAKRLTVAAKSMADEMALDRDIDVLVNAIIQNYRNIDLVMGEKGWWGTGKSVYSLVLTLEEIFVFGDFINKMIDSKLRDRAGSGAFDKTLLNNCPFFLTSAYEFEHLAVVLKECGIKNVLNKKASMENRHSIMAGFLTDNFVEAYENSKRTIFGDDWSSLGRKLGVPLG